MKKASHEGTITINNTDVQCAILDTGERVISETTFSDSEEGIPYIGIEKDSIGYAVTDPYLISIIDQALGYAVVKSDDFNDALKALLGKKK